MILFPVDGSGPWALVTPPTLRVPLAGDSNDSLLLLILEWPQEPLFSLSLVESIICI